MSTLPVSEIWTFAISSLMSVNPAGLNLVRRGVDNANIIAGISQEEMQKWQRKTNRCSLQFLMILCRQLMKGFQPKHLFSNGFSLFVEGQKTEPHIGDGPQTTIHMKNSSGKLL